MGPNSRNSQSSNCTGGGGMLTRTSFVGDGSGSMGSGSGCGCGCGSDGLLGLVLGEGTFGDGGGGGTVAGSV